MGNLNSSLYRRDKSTENKINNFQNNKPEYVKNETEEEKEEKRLKKEKEKEEDLKLSMAAKDICNDIYNLRINNKNFETRIPIKSLFNFPVNVFLVFTYITNYSHGHYDIEKYTIQLKINSRINPDKMLYNTTILKVANLSFSCGSNMSDCISNFTFQEIKLALSILKNELDKLSLDSYRECFTNYRRKMETLHFNEFYSNENIEFESVYNCKVCNEKTKNSDLYCYFCKNKNCEESRAI